MLRSSFYSAGVVLLGTAAFAQSNLSGQARPITAPVKYAGVYHLGTGTWTKGIQSTAGAAGAGIIYDNTCNTGYYGGIDQNEIWIDEGRLPSTSSVVLPSGWGIGNDSEVGTQDNYTVDGFQIAYCTSEGVTRDYVVSFYEAYNACAVVGTQTPTAAFNITGLPGSTGAGFQACWIVDLDLCGQTPSLSFTMQADADGAYGGGTTGDTFGWSFQLTTPEPNDGDGFIVAGGVISAGSPQTCSGSDGTVFDTGTVSSTYPANSDAISLCNGATTLAAGATPEAGSGMGALDRWRIENSVADGCYWFGGVIPGNFHLQIYSANVTLPSVSPAVEYCEPGVSGVVACPCGNPPAGAARGCDNSASTGGASITASGVASLAGDTLTFTTAGQRPTGTTILLQGTTAVAAGVGFGQGVRCVGGSLKRLYVKSASGGSITAPGAGDPTVSARAATLGDVITAGVHRYYAAYYRDPIVLGGCNAFFTFNITDAGDVLWN